MAPNVLSFADHVSDRADRSDWTNAELAELYRVEHALVQARIVVETDRGITDEGDPWFVFCRADGEVVVHVTRFGGQYRLYSPALPQALVGSTFSALTKTFLSELRTPVKADETISIHPAALLSVLVAAIFYSIDFHANSAKAAESPIQLQEPSQRPAVQLHTGGHIEPSITETLYKSLMENVKAFLDSAVLWHSEQLAFLADVEGAAVSAFMALSGFAEKALNLQSDIASATNADNEQSQPPQSHGTSDSANHDQTNEHENIQFASKIFQQTSIVSADQTTTQDGAAKSSAATNPSDDAVIATKGFVAALSSSASTDHKSGDHLPVIDSVQPDGTASPTNVDTLFVVAGQISDDTVLTNHQSISSSSILGSDSQTINITLTQSGNSLDLSASTGADKIIVSGNGELDISGINPIVNPQIDIGENSVQAVSLSFATTATPSFTIQLNGHDAISLFNISADSQSLHVTLDSEGSSSNEFTIADTAISDVEKLNISVVGVQDLTLNESAQTFNNSTLDTSELTGALTLGLNLDNVFQSVDLSQVSAANFIVGDSGNIALLHAADGSHIQLSSDLNMVDLTVAGATIANPGSLALDLQTGAETAAPISISLLDAFYTSALVINSADAGGQNNTIGTLTDSSLAQLTITGDSGLTISSIDGPSASDGQAIIVDAHSFSGSFNIDVSGIADIGTLGRSITVIGGSGDNVLTNNTVTESTTFVVGPSQNTINIGDGAVHDLIAGLTAGDSVNVGGAAHTDVIVNESIVGLAQATIDAASDIASAAQVASSLAPPSGVSEALLFTYQGSLYAFIDTGGDHVFNSSNDAIIKLTGVVAVGDLAGVFHSA